MIAMASPTSQHDTLLASSPLSSPDVLSSPFPGAQEQPLLAQPSLGAAATAPLLEEPYCGSPAMAMDLREDPWPEGMLRATPDKPAFSKTPSPNKEFQEQGLDSSSDHSSRYTPVSEGTKAWIAETLIEGQPLSSRCRGKKRRPALTYNLTVDFYGSKIYCTGNPLSQRDQPSSSSTSFKPTTRRRFDYLPEDQLDFDVEDEEAP